MEQLRGELVELRLRRAGMAVFPLHQPRHHGHEVFVFAEQFDRRESFRLVFRQNVARLGRKRERCLLEARPEIAIRRADAFGRDAGGVGVGCIELFEDGALVHRIGIARQHGEYLGQAGLLAVQLANQPPRHFLFANQAGGALPDGVDIADGHQRGGQQQDHHQAEPGRQHAEDVAVGDRLRLHRVNQYRNSGAQLESPVPAMRRVQSTLTNLNRHHPGFGAWNSLPRLSCFFRTCSNMDL